MELYIQIKHGAPFEHPILGENFRQVFPHIDTNDLPPEFARFERVEPPTIGVYETYEGVTYEKLGDVYKDVHHVRPMTDVEKTEKIAIAMAQSHPDGWVFDEEHCGWYPVPLTTDTLGN